MNYQLIIDDHIGLFGFSKSYVKQVLAGYANKHVDVKISSLGGDLDHGLDIRQQFLDHGDVTVYFSGFVASAATIIALGAKRICMSKHAFMLVHKCSNFVDAWGSYNADQMQELIDQLTQNKKENDKIDVVIAQLYADKCGKSISEILDILKREEWLTADEALEYGFIDEIVDAPDLQKQNFTHTLAAKFNRFGLPTEGLEPKQADSVLDKILSAIRSLQLKFSEPATQEPTKQIFDVMNFQFTNVAALLDIEALATSEDGKVDITADQMQAIENRIAELAQNLADRDNTIADRDNSISELTAQVDTLTAQVEALNAQPGDSTPDGVAEEDVTPENQINSSLSLFNNIKSIL
ncbi:MAG: ATP-dependent Clp protease proteolytic subunit [Muribaculaceae bacterium]|nr:ATP-dependent Clp protease proteolytic subunit [Muribaculaceae bacterium]